MIENFTKVYHLLFVDQVFLSSHFLHIYLRPFQHPFFIWVVISLKINPCSY
ncbi:hypothetical protein Hanom_Chr02g00142311 [Helianthus anomalus]